MNEPRENGRHSSDDNRRMQQQGMADRRFRDEDRGRFGGDREDDRDLDRRMEDRDRGERMGQGYRGERGLRESERYGQSDRGYGQGQSGYMAGRYGEDRSLGSMGRNQGYSDQDRFDDRYSQRMPRGGDETGGGWYGGGGGGGGGMSGRMGGGWGGGQDERWQGRGGQDYWREQAGRQYGSGGMGGGGYGGGMGGPYGGVSMGGGAYSGGPYGIDPRRQDGDERRSFGGYGGEAYGNRSYGEGYGGSRQGMRGKGPKNFQRSDERIREIVCEALSDDDQIDASEIEVEVKSGEVMLRGTVEDRRTKRMAEDLAERVSGCDVQNQLRIGSSAGNKWQVTSRGNQAAGSQVGTSDSEKKHRA